MLPKIKIERRFLPDTKNLLLLFDNDNSEFVEFEDVKPKKTKKKKKRHPLPVSNNLIVLSYIGKYFCLPALFITAILLIVGVLPIKIAFVVFYICFVVGFWHWLEKKRLNGAF